MGSIRVFVMPTSGVKNDGITSWMRDTYGVMDKNGLNLTSIAFDGVEQSVIDSVERSGIKVQFVPNRQSEPVKYAAALRQMLDSCHYDIIHMCCSSALCAFELREAKKRAVGMRIAHSHNTTCAHRVADKVLRPAFYHYATDYYACGRDAGRWLFGNRQFTVIPNGKELDDWAFSRTVRANARAKLGLAESEVAIGHVGRFNEQKNHEKLLHIFAELRKRSDRYRLVLVGDGDLFDRTCELADELGISGSTLFLGRRSDIPRLLNAMDCMVLPSLYEGFPNVVLEWQLSGLPVVMSSSITDEVAITPLVTQVPLDASDNTWADAVGAAAASFNRKADSEAARNTAKERGYDIHDNAAMLRMLYLEGASRCR